ncbi:MAG TPA: hypothetical protein VL092_10565, partial [Chitinophagaceae bacterium]|nr:hypothetical protein [Chitinophagaceae bacterium]
VHYCYRRRKGILATQKLLKGKIAPSFSNIRMLAVGIYAHFKKKKIRNLLIQIEPIAGQYLH